MKIYIAHKYRHTWLGISNLTPTELRICISCYCSSHDAERGPASPYATVTK